MASTNLYLRQSQPNTSDLKLRSEAEKLPSTKKYIQSTVGITYSANTGLKLLKNVTTNIDIIFADYLSLLKKQIYLATNIGSNFTTNINYIKTKKYLDLTTNAVFNNNVLLLRKFINITQNVFIEGLTYINLLKRNIFLLIGIYNYTQSLAGILKCVKIVNSSLNIIFNITTEYVKRFIQIIEPNYINFSAASISILKLLGKSVYISQTITIIINNVATIKNSINIEEASNLIVVTNLNVLKQKIKVINSNLIEFSSAGILKNVITCAAVSYIAINTIFNKLKRLVQTEVSSNTVFVTIVNKLKRLVQINVSDIILFTVTPISSLKLLGKTVFISQLVSSYFTNTLYDLRRICNLQNYSYLSISVFLNVLKNKLIQTEHIRIDILTNENLLRRKLLNNAILNINLISYLNKLKNNIFVYVSDILNFTGFIDFLRSKTYIINTTITNLNTYIFRLKNKYLSFTNVETNIYTILNILSKKTDIYSDTTLQFYIEQDILKRLVKLDTLAIFEFFDILDTLKNKKDLAFINILIELLTNNVNLDFVVVNAQEIIKFNSNIQLEKDLNSKITNIVKLKSLVNLGDDYISNIRVHLDKDSILQLEKEINSRVN